MFLEIKSIEIILFVLCLLHLNLKDMIQSCYEMWHCYLLNK